MATKSFLKNIELRDKKSVERFVRALENAEKFQGKKIILDKQVEYARGEELKKIFGEDDS